jgi:hypothetical protein
VIPDPNLPESGDALPRELEPEVDLGTRFRAWTGGGQHDEACKLVEQVGELRGERRVAACPMAPGEVADQGPVSLRSATHGVRIAPTGVVSSRLADEDSRQALENLE